MHSVSHTTFVVDDIYCAVFIKHRATFWTFLLKYLTFHGPYHVVYMQWEVWHKCIHVTQALLTARQEKEIQLKMLLTRGESVQRNTSAEGVPLVRQQIEDLKDSWDGLLSASIQCKRSIWLYSNQCKNTAVQKIGSMINKFVFDKSHKKYIYTNMSW